MKTIFRRLALLLACALAAPAVAQPGLQDLDALERRLVIALGADIGQPGGPVAPLDRRLRLMACPSDVLIEPPVLNAATLRCAQIGWRIRVPLTRSAGVAQASVAAAPTQRAAPVIRRGDPVEIRAVTGSIVVSQAAVAQQDGAPGDRIRVRTDARADPIVVEVVDSGIVRLPGFN